MPNTAVARTCQYTAGWNDQSRRTTVLPGCGPAAVANVPLTISTNAANATTSPAARTHDGTSGSARCVTSSASTTPSVSTAIESMKCVSTSQGFRW